MGKTESHNKGIVFTSLSLLLALFVVAAWVLFTPIRSTGFSKFIVLVLECLAITFGVLGFRQIKRVGNSWSTVTLSVISLLTNGAVLFLSLLTLVTDAPEVRGIVHTIGDNSIAIYVDEGYRDEFNMDGSRLSSLDESSSASEKSDFLVYISQRTVISEKYGEWFWQRRVASMDSLQSGQHIQIKYDGWRYLDGSIMEASEIVILSE